MKKLLLLIMFSLLMMVSAVGLTACGDTPEGDGDNPPHEHSYSSSTIAPTCTEDGYTTYICECGDTYNGNYVNKLGHNYIHHQEKKATCTEIGWNAYDTCSRCDYTTYEKISALGHELLHHDGQEATCTEIGWNAYDTCSECSYTTYVEIAAFGHNLISYEKQEATCSEVGWNAYDTCSRCDYTTYEKISALGHTEEILQAVEATCTQTGLSEGKKCLVCNEITLEQTVTEALGHSEEILQAVEATCTQTGLTEGKKCLVCNEITLEQTVTEVLGHLYTDYIYNNDATNGIDGTKTAVCDRDNCEETNTIVAEGTALPFTITYLELKESVNDNPSSYTVSDENIVLKKLYNPSTGYSFKGWQLDGEIVTEIDTSIKKNITLTATWVPYALNSIVYDTAKKVISVNDTLEAQLFSATCTDTDGETVPITVTANKTYVAGDTITVRLEATKSGKTERVTIQDVKVYGMPSLDFDNTVTYFNMDNLTAEWFTASGLDTFGTATNIEVYVDYEYKSGDYVTVTIASVDPSGNRTYGYVQNVMAYDKPVITYDEEKTGVSVNDTINAEFFNASAKDSFGVDLELTVTNIKGSLDSETTITVEFSSTDSKGNNTTFSKNYKVYGMPTINYAQVTEFKETDLISNDVLKVKAYDVYGEELDVTFTVKQGEQKAGTVMVLTATVTDISGNTTTRDMSFRIYGMPTISYKKEALQVTDVVIGNERRMLKAFAYNSFGEEIAVTATLKSGEMAGGSYVVYTLTTTDHLGNIHSIDTAEIPVYDISAIKDSFTYSLKATNIKATSMGEEFEASAIDSFGNPCEITIIVQNGGSLIAGQTSNIYIVATDKAGNSKISALISNINVYGQPTIEYTGESELLPENVDITFDIVAKDSFGKEIYADIVLDKAWADGEKMTATVTATDDAGNTTVKEFVFHCAHEHIMVESIVYDCYRQGYTLHLCSICGYSYKDNFTDVWTSHIHSEDAIGVVTEPTCTENGYTVYECERCGKYYESDLTFAIGHNYVGGYCIGCGDTEIISSGLYGTNLTWEIKVYEHNSNYLKLTISGSGEIQSSLDIEDHYKALIKQVIIKSDVTSIGDRAFSSCSKLTSITFGENSKLTSIGSSAFNGCKKLTSVKIGNNVSTIGEQAFNRCGALESITVENGNVVYKSDGNTIIEKATNTLVLGCKNSIIPNYIKSIGHYAFYDCEGLTSIAVPKSVEIIGASAFSECAQLTSISFNGTKAEWNAISKVSGWDLRMGDYTVYCTDGQITKQ